MSLAMSEIVCACGCGRTRMVRTADIKRGWGRYFSKSCKQTHQMRLRAEKVNTNNEGESNV